MGDVNLVPVSRCRPLAAFLLVAAPLAAQSRSQELLGIAQGRIAARQWDAADEALSGALASALYVMDSVNAFVWRGILEHLRGNDSLASANFRRVVQEHHITSVNGLEKISPALAELFDAEARIVRIYADSQLDHLAGWQSGPQFEYPKQLIPYRVSGRGIVRAVVDSMGRVDERTVTVLESPDSAFEEPLRRMMIAAQFTPARRGGHAVRSEVTLGFTLNPPAPQSPAKLVTDAREQLRLRRPDSALALVARALDDVNQATEAERVYALLVQGKAWHVKGRDSLATTAFDAALAGYHDLTARGVDLAPVLKRLADSIRISRRAVSRAQPPTTLAAPTAVEGVDEQPALISHPPIRYAPEMQALRIGGTVIVEATLDTTGRVIASSAKVVQSPNPIFDAEAKRVTIAALYRPARISGRPARVTIRQPITFAPY